MSAIDRLTCTPNSSPHSGHIRLSSLSCRIICAFRLATREKLFPHSGHTAAARRNDENDSDDAGEEPDYTCYTCHNSQAKVKSTGKFLVFHINALLVSK